MAQEYIGVGSSANDGLGDPLRVAFQKTNNNFTQLFQAQAGDLSVTGNIVATKNITGGNIYSLGTISSVGNIEINPSNYFVGNGFYLTGLAPTYSNANVAAYLPFYSGNMAGLTVTGNLSVIGDITSTDIIEQMITVVGNVIAGNVLSSNIMSATGNIIASGFQYANGSPVQGSGAQGTVGTQGTTGTQGTVGAQGFNGTVGSQGTTGTQGTVGAQGFNGTVGSQGTTGTQGTTGSGAQGTTGAQGVAGAQGTIGAQGTTGSGAQGTTGAQGVQGLIGPGVGAQGTTGTTGAQGTTGTTGAQGTTGTGAQGATGSQGATGNPFGGGTFTGTITTQSILPGANVTYDIGSSTAYYANIYGTSTTARYADLAEYYLADRDYAPGTVVSFGGNQEVTISTMDSDSRIAGVVSTNPAYVMNGALKGDHVVAVALQGRAPCLVVGPVQAGDLMVSDGTGRARSESDPKPGAVIGKAIKGFDDATGVIEIVVGRV